MRFGLLALILAGCDASVTGTTPIDDPANDNVDTPPANTGDFLDNQSRSEGDHITGAALRPDGRKLVLGVYGATCAFRSATGVMEEDQDVEEGDDDVDDGDEDTEDGEGMVALVAGPQSVKLVNIIEEYDTFASWYVQGHITSRIIDDAVVSIAQQGLACVAEWRTVGSPSARTLDIDGGACTAAFIDVDPNGTAWVSTGNGVIGLSGNSVTTLPGGADVTVWDEVAQAFYGFHNGDTTVTAWEASGALRWSHTMEGVVRGLDDMNGNAAVSFQGPDGAEIALLDGQTGEQIEAQAVRGSSGKLQFRGGILAHVQPRSVDLFRPVE
jgi:hypothetical protein